MGTMGLADLAKYYWLGERVCVARRAREARVQAARVRADRIRTSIYSRAVAKKMHWKIRKAWVF